MGALIRPLSAGGGGGPGGRLQLSATSKVGRGRAGYRKWYGGVGEVGGGGEGEGRAKG